MMSTLRKLSSFDNDIDFTRLWRKSLALSAVLVLVSIGAIVGRGMNFGIDFEGGDSYEVPSTDLSVGDARDALAEVGQEGAKIQILGGDTLRVQTPTLSEEARAEVRATLSEATGTEANEISVSSVGPSWGDEISEKAIRALIIFLVVIAVYLSVRLEWQMAVGSLVGMVHDLVISVGVYALFQFEVTPATVIAFLTILGFSLYDGIVVFDKVQENQARASVAARMPYSDTMSLSLNQTLMRSLNTSITALLPIVSLLLVGSFGFGAVTLQEFGVALFVGIMVGAYSSVFVASPVVAFIREREPKFVNLRQRLEAQAPGAGPVATTRRDRATDAVTVGSVTTTPDPGPGPAPAPAPGRTAGPRPASTSIPPRPRKKGRRR